MLSVVNQGCTPSCPASGIVLLRHVQEQLKQFLVHLFAHEQVMTAQYLTEEHYAVAPHNLLVAVTSR